MEGGTILDILSVGVYPGNHTILRHGFVLCYENRSTAMYFLHIYLLAEMDLDVFVWNMVASCT